MENGMYPHQAVFPNQALHSFDNHHVSVSMFVLQEARDYQSTACVPKKFTVCLEGMEWGYRFYISPTHLIIFNLLQTMCSYHRYSKRYVEHMHEGLNALINIACSLTHCVSTSYIPRGRTVLIAY